MSSLKGQLANVEGSVKSMKMAIVVGSVLTVACLAAVFGVTILANEVSKETKVSGGSLVNRQGSNVVVASKKFADLRESMLAHQIVIGDVIQMPVKGGKVFATVQRIVELDNGDVVLATNDEMIIAETAMDYLQFFGSDHSSVNLMDGAEKLETMYERSVEARKLNIPWWQLACIAGHLGLEIYGLISGLIDAGEATWEDVMAALVKEGLGMIIDSIGMGACGKFAVAVIGAMGSL